MTNIKNNFQVVGHIGELETKTTSKEKKVSNFSVAINYKSGDNATTTWVKVTAFDKTAEIIEKYAKKGSHIGVSGYMKNNNYDDKDGNKRYEMSFIAEEVLLLDKKD